MSTRQEIIKHIDRFVKENTKKHLNDVVDYATKSAQLNYDRFCAFELPTDYPVIWVENTPIRQHTDYFFSRTITAIGTSKSLLFAEFGAGKYFYTEVETRLYHDIIPNDRPIGVSGIGEYGVRGKDDYWFYKSETGREAKGTYVVRHNKAGNPIMITHGNRPARALYRGVGMAVRRLLGGKLK